jgi:hypothetical protein
MHVAIVEWNIHPLAEENLIPWTDFYSSQTPTLSGGTFRPFVPD